VFIFSLHQVLEVHYNNVHRLQGLHDTTGFEVTAPFPYAIM
jgi:hypothetical protein